MADLPFLEREAFAASLVADFAAVADGSGRIALVSGEAGIGKTTLLERLAANVVATATGRVLWGACDALSTPHPLAPLYDIAATTDGPWRGMLALVGARPALFAAVLDELGRTPPTVLIIEDAHWADAATLDLLRYLGRRIQRLPVLLIVSYRDDEVDRRHPLRAVLGDLPPRRVARLALPQLSAAAVTRLAQGTGRDGAAVHAATAGNPFFVTEVLAHAGPDVPGTVRDAVLARVARLDPAARAAVELTAIVPRALEGALLERIWPALAPFATATAALDPCIDVGLLVAEHDRFRFRHELARVAVETSIGTHRARVLHTHVLAALGADDVPEQLARKVHHAQRAGDAATVVRLAPAAAREAGNRGARREAIAHCRAALAHPDLLPDGLEATLLDELAGHAFELNDLDTAISARAAAIESFAARDDRVSRCRALAAHTMPLVRALRNAEADTASRAAIALAEALPAAEQARAYATESYLRMLDRDVDDALHWGERAIACATSAGDRAALADGHLTTGAALLFVDYRRGIERILRSLELARELNDPMRIADAYVMLGTGSGEVQRYDEAERWIAEGLAFTGAHDLDRLGGYLGAWQALVDVARGRWQLGAERALAVLARAAAGSTNRVMALVALGRVRVRRGDPDSAGVLDEALALAAASGTLQRMAPVRAARAEAAWLADDFAAVGRETSDALALAIAKRHPWFTGELASWLQRGAVVTPLSGATAPAYAASIAGRWSEAAALWQAAGCPYERASELARGDEPAQREALSIFDGLGAAPIARRLRRTMREQGVVAVPRGPRASTLINAAGLTARELQVLALAAEGRHDAEIAARLSRSTRTVEHHMAAVLGKLAVGSRTEAVVAARRRGLLPNAGQDG